MKKLMIIAAVSMFTACAAKMSKTKATAEKEAPVAFPTTAQVEAAKMVFPEMTDVSFKETHAFYADACGACHAAKAPSARNESQWRSIMPNMVRKANKKGYSIDAIGEQKLLAYVLAMRAASNNE